MTAVEIRRAADRFHTRLEWLDSWHSFSFGPYYDPRNTHFGLLIVSNEDTVAPGAGFGTHPHRDMEIVTWLLEGALVHRDSTGNGGVIYPGLAQRMSAGGGIRHSERNQCTPAGIEPTLPAHFVQMWVVPDSTGTEPGYQQVDVSADLARGGLVTVASGIPRDAGRSPLRIQQRAAAMHVARLRSGESVGLPEAPYLHLFVARGAVRLVGTGAGPGADSGLAAGDAARISGSDGHRVVAAADAEVLAWEMHAALGRPGRG